MGYHQVAAIFYDGATAPEDPYNIGQFGEMGLQTVVPEDPPAAG